LLASWAAGQQLAEKKTSHPAPLPAAAAPTLSYRGAHYEPSNRRDPFLNPLLLKRDEDPNEEAPRGSPPPGIAGMTIREVQLLGISVSTEEQTACFFGTDKRVYFLHVGDRLFDGYVKSIAMDAVQLIRETTLKSGKVLTQEVTKRLRTS
jgi:hypothetical protein